MDWTLPRARGVYRFVRVDYTTRQELEQLTTVMPGGSIVRSLDSDLKESGTLPCVGPIDLGDDLVRVYYDATDSAGASESVALATMHAVKATAQYSEAVETADLTLYSALLTLQQAALAESLTIAADSVAVTEAAAICTALGLPVVPSASTKALTADASWDAGTPRLKPVNELMAFAGYWSAHPDEWGRVKLAPYESPAERSPVWEFVEGENCTYLPQVTLESDGFDVPNQCVVTSSNPAGVIVGTYTNDDPLSPYSTVTRGRPIALPITVDDAVDEADANARAERELKNATFKTERLTIEHAYCPVTIGDVVHFVWEKHGLSIYAAVQSQTLKFGPACMVTSTLKRVRSS